MIPNRTTHLMLLCKVIDHLQGPKYPLFNDFFVLNYAMFLRTCLRKNYNRKTYQQKPSGNTQGIEDIRTFLKKTCEKNSAKKKNTPLQGNKIWTLTIPVFTGEPFTKMKWTKYFSEQYIYNKIFHKTTETLHSRPSSEDAKFHGFPWYILGEFFHEFY